MEPRATILIDFEEAFNSYTGIPLSVVNDVLCLANADFQIILWYHNHKKTKLITEWINQFFSPDQRELVELSNTRPSNFMVWLSQVLPRNFFKEISVDYVYSRLFPRLPLSGGYTTILRIDDPFGLHSSAPRNFISDTFSGMKPKHAIARALRTHGLNRLDKNKVIKVFNSNWTLNLWNSIYKDVSERDFVIYPPVQFSIDDHFKQPDEIVLKKKQKPYFVFIGGQRQRKDPLSIINLWASHLKCYKFDFVLIGSIPENLITPSVLGAIKGKRLSLLKNLPSDELRGILKDSRGIVFNSKGEGFGNPIAEAIYLNLNLVCNNLEVFKEVAGNYANYFENGNYFQALEILSLLSEQANQTLDVPPRKYTFVEAIESWHFLNNR